MRLSVLFTIFFSVLIGILIGARIEDSLILRKAFENSGVITLDGITYKIEVLRSES